MTVCIERKRYLSGGEITFVCELVALEGNVGVLKYVLDREWQVHGLTLRPGHVTYAFYWTDRPYNLYWWVDERGATLGYYFNLVDSVELAEQEFSWRDLVVDLLVLPDGQVYVIDEDQAPGGLNSELKAYIEAGKRQVLQDYGSIVMEAARLFDRYVHGR